MFLSKRRLVLIGTVAAIAVVIVLLPLILTITLPDLNKVNIAINKIEIKEFSDKNNSAIINVSFDITNPTSQALTTSKIDYKLFANGNSLGDHTISYADIPVNGRPQILSNGNSTIKDSINVPISNEKLAKDLRSNSQKMQNINWRVEGIAIIESGFSSAPKAFNASK